MIEVLGIVLAGGRGERLMPLTQHRAKPAVPFGSKYRLIDFVLSNFINSGIYRLKVLTQFKSDSLNMHLARGWNFGTYTDYYVDPIPAQMRTGEGWYQGTADSVYQNFEIINQENPEHVAIFGGDHIYKMDIGQMFDFHKEKQADLTVAAIPFPREDASDFGIIEVDDNWRIIGFEEKPADPKPIPGRPDWSLVSMGNYFFKWRLLMRLLEEDSRKIDSSHDFGRDIIPSIFESRPVYAYDFSSNHIPGELPEARAYWRDVGTLDTYYQSNLDLRAVSPVFNLYNPRWPVRTYSRNYPPSKFVFADYGDRCGQAIDSIIGNGCIISGGTVVDSVLFQDVFVHSYSHVDGCVIFDHVEIQREVKLINTLVDKGAIIGQGAEIGFDLERDRRNFHVSPGGIVVIPKNAVVDGATNTIVAHATGAELSEA
jgi:glucose-1-phosphate adenylyltransferase